MAKTYTWRTYREAGSTIELVIPDGYTEIEKETFRNYKSLKSVTIPEGVKKIGWRSFEGCTSLLSVTILNPNITIGKTSFFGCTALTEVNLPDCLDWIKENDKVIASLLAKNKYLAAKEAAKMAKKEKPAGNMRRLKITRSQTRYLNESNAIVGSIKLFEITSNFIDHPTLGLTPKIFWDLIRD